MTAAILSIGTELTRGEIVDTNSAWLAASLTESGHDVVAIHTTPDDAPQLIATLRKLGEDHALLVVTGGLGPTSDDITSSCAAAAAGVVLHRSEDALGAIRRRLELRGKALTPHHEKQADVPLGSEILSNANGTAPGFSFKLGKATAFFLPGVPNEMKRMFAEQVLPRLRPQTAESGWMIRLRTFGLTESAASQLLEDLESAHAGIKLGYRVDFPEVDIKIHARGADQSEAHERAVRAAREVRSRLGDLVYGEGDDTLPLITGRALRIKNYRLALAESCTGGYMTHLLTAFPGASDFLIGSAVVYANSAKTRLLGVSEDILRGHGAVSAEVAAAMAEGIRRVCDTDVGVSVTGIAGPGGGTADKPVGLVYWAVSHPGGTIVKDQVFWGSRSEIQSHAAHAALDLVRRIAMGLPDDPAIPPPRSRR